MWALNISISLFPVIPEVEMTARQYDVTLADTSRNTTASSELKSFPRVDSSDSSNFSCLLTRSHIQYFGIKASICLSILTFWPFNSIPAGSRSSNSASGMPSLKQIELYVNQTNIHVKTHYNTCTLIIIEFLSFGQIHQGIERQWVQVTFDMKM